jgi:uncharacterized GH25 family protein
MRLLSLLVVFICAGSCRGHDLKVFASRLHLPHEGGKATIYLGWGHVAPVDELIDAKTLDRYELHGPKGATSLKTADVSLQANAVLLAEPGVHQAVVSRKPSILTWVFDADGNRVMKRGSRTTVKEGKIDVAQRSHMFGKAVIVVGAAGSATVKALGLPLEIVPVEGPSAWKSGTALGLQVLHASKPLAGAQLHAARVGDAAPDDDAAHDAAPSLKTDAQGIARLSEAGAGTWVFKVQHRIPTTGAVRQEYDYEALTSTLVLEVSR